MLILTWQPISEGVAKVAPATGATVAEAQRRLSLHTPDEISVAERPKELPSETGASPTAGETRDIGRERTEKTAAPEPVQWAAMRSTTRASANVIVARRAQSKGTRGRAIPEIGGATLLVRVCQSCFCAHCRPCRVLCYRPVSHNLCSSVIQILFSIDNEDYRKVLSDFRYNFRFSRKYYQFLSFKRHIHAFFSVLE
ncbi:uncharacterized protein LOC120770709 [Bactrocera tryoni]|uniref:uncharacterized protein LOC120770709 n=1 Tax=Bactrocera tryoni TaxID=59916 RepID=UPI001A9672B4|nr:uncharacterized protein LOC120770709 [Bactrocera tryoni]